MGSYTKESRRVDDGTSRAEHFDSLAGYSLNTPDLLYSTLDRISMLNIWATSKTAGAHGGIYFGDDCTLQ